MKVVCKDKRSYFLQTEVVALYCLKLGENGGDETRGRKRQSEWLKEVFVHRLALLESVSSPGSSHKADVELPLALAQTERVQKLLCMPVRDLLTQISAGSQMRDRCSKRPVEYRLLITATWARKLLFIFTDD